MTGRQITTIDMNRIIFAALGTLTLALACSHPPPGRGAGEVETSPQTQTSFKVETVVGGLEVPWSIVWAPDGRMIFTERPGRVRDRGFLAFTSAPRSMASRTASGCPGAIGGRTLSSPLRIGDARWPPTPCGRA